METGEKSVPRISEPLFLLTGEIVPDPYSSERGVRNKWSLVSVADDHPSLSACQVLVTTLFTLFFHISSILYSLSRINHHSSSG
jgi:hypothetical protein